MTNHIKTVQSMYDAFQKGDIAFVVSCFANDIVWEYAPTTAAIPWLAPRKGKQEAAGFFEALSQVELTKFKVNHVMGDGNVVVGLIDIEGTIKATGKKVVENDEAHVWHFDATGKVSKFRHCADTYKHFKALER